jgi:segregation and condensation protein A
VPFTVSIPVFEGPFDLLLHLISREQVDLWEVSLATIVDAYVETLAAMGPVLDLDGATEFLLIAAVLVDLKAHRLLPEPETVDLDEEVALWEERDLLLSRLLECKTFKDAAGALTRLMDAAGRSWPRTAGLEERFASLAPDPLAGVSPEKLRDALRAVLSPRPAPRVALDHIHQIRTTVADAVAELTEELPRVGRISFARLTDGLVERLDVIVRFLALLELYKQGMVELDQAGTFAELRVCWTGGDEDAVLDPSAVEEYSG